MANNMNEQEQFLKGLESDQNQKIDVLEQPLGATGGAPAKDEAKGATGATGQSGDDEDGDGTKPRNRRERRLLQKLQEERESSIFLSGKLAARNEAEKAVTEEVDYLKGLERIYGTDTPEAQLATDLLKKAIVGAQRDAYIAAIDTVRAEKMRERQDYEIANRELDSIIEDVEDTHNVDLNDVQKRSFFQLMHKMSPKDGSGAVVAYADPHAVWDIFSERIQKKGTDSRAKDRASRSMVQSGASKESTLPDDTTARFLRENNII